MRTKTFVFLSVLTALSLDSFGTDYYVATSALNVRSGEGMEYPVSFVLKKGEEVAVVTRSNGWYGITRGEKTGYAYSKYLEYNRSVFDTRPRTTQQDFSWFPLTLCIGLLLIVLFCLIGYIRDNALLKTVTKSNRGERAERKLVIRLLKYGIPAHAIFHDLYLAKERGHFSQVDLVAVTSAGILVFEVKDYKGWIFGNGDEIHWTQVLAYGKQRYRFYNPIKQNNNHLAELARQIAPFGSVPLYSIVVFYGSCVLKEISYVPKDTFLVKSERVLRVVNLILQQNGPVHYNDDGEVTKLLRQAVVNGGILDNKVRHRKNIEDWLGGRGMLG